jgi:ATP-dependent DNA helicase RecQ
VGMLEQAGLVERGLDDGRRMRIEVPAPPGDAPRRVEELLERARLVAEKRADLVISFAESDRCRHAQVAAHFGESLDPPCGACDVCAPSEQAFIVPSDIVAPLPDDIGESITYAVSRLRWPLGRRSLVAMLRGSVSAPPTARSSPSFGILASASESDVRRWIGLLEQAGALVERTTPEGYRVLEADRAVSSPRIAVRGASPVDTGLFERLRSWRADRARADSVPAYVVFPDATLRDVAALHPTSLGELATVKGVGPAKLERYGDDVLSVVGAG